MRSILTVAAISMALSLATASEVSAANLLSGSVSLSNNYPTDTNIFDGPYTGPTAGGITTNDGYVFSFTGNTISYYNPYVGNYVGNGTDFNGWVLTFAGVPNITGVTNDPGSEMNPLSISFNTDTIKLNFSGLYRPSATTSIFDVSLAGGVPEPATWATLLLGFGGIGFMLRRLRDKDIVVTA